MLKVEQVEEHEWRFVYPPKYDELMDKFDEDVELWETGHTRSAEKCRQRQAFRIKPAMKNNDFLKIILPTILYPEAHGIALAFPIKKKKCKNGVRS